MHKIPTFIINLDTRSDRRTHILKEFKERDEFDVNLFSAIESVNGAEGLWLSIQAIVKQAALLELDFVLICEDDHVFTDEYNSERLKKHIQSAIQVNCDILIGGPSSCRGYMFPIDSSSMQVEFFTGTQFIIIFKTTYHTIINFQFEKESQDGADLIFSRITKSKIVIHPFFSRQAEFGYSDVTPFYNTHNGYVEELFRNCHTHLDLIRGIFSNIIHYDNSKLSIPSNWEIPTYIFYYNEGPPLDRILHELKDKEEFNVVEIIEIQEEKNNVEIFKSIMEQASLADEEVILILNNFHVFQQSYNSIEFGQQLYNGILNGLDALLGISYNATNIIPVNKNLFWANILMSDQFLIIFKPFFSKIITYDFVEDNFYGELSHLTLNKFILHPFISKSKMLNPLEECMQDCNTLFNKYY